MPSYTFDPDGDLVLVLTSPANKPDATGKNTAEGTADAASKKRKRFSLISPSSPQHAPVTIFERVNMTVSSKHVCLASPVFKAMLQPGRFREGLHKNAAGKMEVSLPDDEEALMVILLNIVHGRNRLVPKEVCLELLTKLAVLADKYQMVEAIEWCSDTWIANIIAVEGLPHGDGGDYRHIQRWVVVSWVFRRQKEFSTATRAAMMASRSYLEETNSELPIPQKVMDMIAQKREANISTLFTFIHKTIEEYKGPQPICPSASHSWGCDAMIFGDLTKTCTKHGIWPTLEPPYEGISLASLSRRVANLGVVSLCEYLGQTDERINYNQSNDHGLQDLLRGEIMLMEDKLTGLDLKAFQK